MVESVFSSFNVSLSGLTAQRRKLDIISSNIANAYTTRSDEGGAYKRKDISFAEKTFGEQLYHGVSEGEVVTDQGEGMRVYDPSHPDAAKDGYVTYPNVNIVDEMVAMIQATRAYEANVQAFTATKTMITKSFDLLV